MRLILERLQARVLEQPGAEGNDLPSTATAVVDVPKWGFVKPDDDGRTDIVSPLPCPFNYGSVPGTRAGDGDRVDAIVLGPRLHAGARVTLPVQGFVDFIDADCGDPKWLLAASPLTAGERRTVTLFFALYGPGKAALNALRRKPGKTVCRGVFVRG